MLFSKNHGDNQTSVYLMPKTIGTHIAINSSTYNIQGMITGATYDDITSEIFLTGYNGSLVPFVVYLGNYIGTDVFGGSVDKKIF